MLCWENPQEDAEEISMFQATYKVPSMQKVWFPPHVDFFLQLETFLKIRRWKKGQVWGSATAVRKLLRCFFRLMFFFETYPERERFQDPHVKSTKLTKLEITHIWWKWFQHTAKTWHMNFVSIVLTRAFNSSWIQFRLPGCSRLVTAHIS